MVLEIGIPKTIGLPMKQNHARECLVRNFKKLIQTILFEMMKYMFLSTALFCWVSPFDQPYLSSPQVAGPLRTATWWPGAKSGIFGRRFHRHFFRRVSIKHGNIWERNEDIAVKLENYNPVN